MEALNLSPLKQKFIMILVKENKMNKIWKQCWDRIKAEAQNLVINFWEYLFEFVDFHRKDIVRNVINSILSFPLSETVMVKYDGGAT